MSNKIEHIRLLHHMSKNVLEILLKTNLDLKSVLETLRVYTGFDEVNFYFNDDIPIENPEYLSSILIPIDHAGFIYLADREANLFNMNIIEIFENIASNISISLMRQKAEKEKQDLYEHLIYKNQILESFKNISHLLLDCNEDIILNQILQIIGETFFVSRTYFFETLPLDKNNYILSNKYEWCDNKIKSVINNKNMQNTSFKDLDLLDLQNILLDNKPYVLNNVTINEVLLSQDIKSLIIVPIFYPFNNLYGFIGVDECDRFRNWKQCEIDSLIKLSNLIGSFIKKCYLEKRLNKFINDQSIILNNIDSYVWFFRDINTYGFMNEKYYIDFIEREDLGENQTTYKNDCLISECHIKEESELQISTNKQVLESKKIVRYEQWLTSKSGDKRLLDIKKILVNDTHIVCIAKDITVQTIQDRKIIKTLTDIYKENTKVLDENIHSMQQMYQKEA